MPGSRSAVPKRRITLLIKEPCCDDVAVALLKMQGTTRVIRQMNIPGKENRVSWLVELPEGPHGDG